MIRNIWLLIRKRVVSPVILSVFAGVMSLLFGLIYMGMHIPEEVILCIVNCVILMSIQIGRYVVTTRNELKYVQNEVDYSKRYEMFVKEVEENLTNDSNDMRLYIYPGWTKYFHVYLMRMLRRHEYKEITDASVLAALTKALVMKYDNIEYIKDFLDAVADRFCMPQTYTVTKDDDGGFTFTVKDRKEFKCYKHMEYTFGSDFIARHVKRLLNEDANLADLEEFYGDLYFCGIDMKNI